MLQSLDVHMKSSDHFRMFWYPHSDDVMVYNVSRTTKVTQTLNEYAMQTNNV
jgi:hypothetical protein